MENLTIFFLNSLPKRFELKATVESDKAWKQKDKIEKKDKPWNAQL